VEVRKCSSLHFLLVLIYKVVMEKIYILVGDEYANFAKHGNVLTVSQLMQKLEEHDGWNGDERFIFGLGIEKGTQEFLKNALHQRGVEEITSHDALAPAHLTHKKYLENTLITVPRKIRPMEYEFHLCLDNRVDRLSDHVTGQHLGAMLLVEASRQAAIAAVELEYCSGGEEKKSGLIIEQFVSRFSNYAFPIPTRITASINELGRSANGNASLECWIKFSQVGKEVCAMCMVGSMPQRAQLEVVEARMARSSVNALRKQYEAQVVTG
jgi:A-factor biosynthesis hotdog domain